MLIVGTDHAAVEADLLGRLLACPGCDGVLQPWSHARVRVLRRRDGEEDRLRPRRGRCRGCERPSRLFMQRDEYTRQPLSADLCGRA